MTGIPLLTLLMVVPAVGGVLCLLLPRDNPRAARQLAFFSAVAALLLAVPLWSGFSPGQGGFRFVEFHEWIPSLGAGYHVGVDGISLFLVLLTVVLTPLALLSAWNSVNDRVREFCAAVLFLETAMVGVFVALDLFLFYVFWEAMLVPMYLLIAVWGGPDRRYAAVKFILYTVVGSLLMLVAILYLYTATGVSSFSLEEILNAPRLPFLAQAWLFGAFFLAFAVKVPLFPFHTWLPNAHVEAPTAGSVILAGVLLKMGVYGFIRFAMPLFPDAFITAAPAIAVLSLVGIIYGAFLALAQSDMKKLVAYSSVSHLGFVMLGLATLRAEGLLGGLYQSLNHGVSTGALFLLVGALYERRHTREMDRYGGLASTMPFLAVALVIISLSSIGLPGLNGFVGEFLILLGAFRHQPLWGVIGAAGIVLGAVYMLRMVQKVIFGTAADAADAGGHEHGHGGASGGESMTDLDGRELLAVVPLVVLAFLMGLFPTPVLSRMQPAVDELLRRLGQGG